MHVFHANALANNVAEYEVKAVFLYHFTQFNKWPESAFSSSDSDFKLCIVGRNPFGDTLNQVLSRKYKNHPITVHYFGHANGYDNCQLVYINVANIKDEKQILTLLKGKPILTVSSRTGFVKRGGNIEFVIVKDSVRFSINRISAELNGIRNSAKLLELAVSIINK